MEGHLPCVQQLSLHGASRHAREWDLGQGLRFVAGPVETIATALAAHQETTSDAQQVLDFLVASREWSSALHHLELLSPRRVTVLLRCGADPHASVGASDAAGAAGTMGAVEEAGAAAAAAAAAWEETSAALGLTEASTLGALAAGAAGAIAASAGAAVAAVGLVETGAAVAAGAAMGGAAGAGAAGAGVAVAAVAGVAMAMLAVVPAATGGAAIAVVRGARAAEAVAAFSLASGATRAAVAAAAIASTVVTVTMAGEAGEAGMAVLLGGVAGAAEAAGAAGAVAGAVETGAAGAPTSAPTPHSRAMLLAARGEAATGEEVAGSCALLLLAGGPWSPTSHGLFPAAARARAATMLRLGHMLSARFAGQEAAWTGIWLEIIMPRALDRGVSDHPTPAAAEASAAACMARDAARGWRLPWTGTHTARHESKWHLAPAYHAMPHEATPQ